MKKISSSLTGVYRYNYKYIVFIEFLILIFIYFYFALNDIFIIIATVILFFTILPWFLNMRKLKDVFIEKNKIIVDDDIEIYFDEIISLNQSKFSYDYKIVYKKNNEIKSFIFLPKFTLPFFTPSFIKEIKKGMKNQ